MSISSLRKLLHTLEISNERLQSAIESFEQTKFDGWSGPALYQNIGVTEVTEDIILRIKDQGADLENLAEEVIDMLEMAPPKLKPQVRQMKDEISRAQHALHKYQVRFRNAQLIVKQRHEAALRAERTTRSQASSSLQPSRFTSEKPRSAEISSEEREIMESRNVTVALRRTQNMMADELSRSQFAHETLNQSTAALAQLSESYSSLDTLLYTSKNLLGTLLRSQKSDTWYLETAFYVLLTTIAWLIFRRLFYGPLWWLLWLPLKMLVKGLASIIPVFKFVGDTSSETNLRPPISKLSYIRPDTKTSARQIHVAQDLRPKMSRKYGTMLPLAEQVCRIADEVENQQYLGARIKSKKAPKKAGGYQYTPQNSRSSSPRDSMGPRIRNEL